MEINIVDIIGETPDGQPIFGLSRKGRYIGRKAMEIAEMIDSP